MLMRTGRARGLEVSEFMRILLSLRLTRSYPRFFRSVRRNAKLRPTVEAHRIVSDLLLVAESRSTRYRAAIPNLDDKDELEAYVRKITARNAAAESALRSIMHSLGIGSLGVKKRLNACVAKVGTPDAVSELALLVEQLTPRAANAASA